MNTRTRLGAAVLGAVTLALAPLGSAQAAPVPAAAVSAGVLADAPAPSMLGRWHYVSGPNGTLDPGQDWLVDVSQAADGTLVGTIVTSSHTFGPCVVGGVIWRNISSTAAGVWVGEQSSCDGTFIATRFYASETGRLLQGTGDARWWLEPVPAG